MALAPAPLAYQLKGAVFAAQACSCVHDPAGTCTGDVRVLATPVPVEIPVHVKAPICILVPGGGLSGTLLMLAVLKGWM